MALYDEELHRLHQEQERKRQLERMTADLRAQRAQLAEKTAELERTKLAEQADVDRLEWRAAVSRRFSTASLVRWMKSSPRSGQRPMPPG